MRATGRGGRDIVLLRDLRAAKAFETRFCWAREQLMICHCNAEILFKQQFRGRVVRALAD